jgi:hypothetical protein
MTTIEQDLRGAYDIDNRGIVRDHGKFEGCHWVALVAYEKINSGFSIEFCDYLGTEFSLVALDIEDQASLYMCREDDQGFFYIDQTTRLDWEKFVEDAAQENSDWTDEEPF